jgi:hypothetical protein
MKTLIKNPILQSIRRCAAVLAASVAVISSASAATVAFGDFNTDGLMDVAAITSPTTVTVSLANPDGSYTVSAILSAPKNKKINFVQVFDFNGDGALDVIASGPVIGGWYTDYILFGNGDGTFGSMVTRRWRSNGNFF